MKTRKPLALFWKALDEIPEANTDRREWLLRLGNDWPVASAYLTATGVLAKEISCPAPGADGCPRKVVKYADSRFRAVCGNKPAECDPVDLSREEVTCLTLDRTKLANSVGAILSVESRVRCCEQSRCNGRRFAWRGGRHRHPSHLNDSWSDGATFADMLMELGVGPGPLAIAVPTTRSLPKKLKTGLSAKGHSILCLTEIATVDGHRLFGAAPAETLLHELRQTLLAKQLPTTSKPVWLLPADARWEDLTFEFIAYETLNVRFRTEVRKFSPEQLGMRNKKNGKPTLAWSVLLIMATKDGRLSWKDRQATVQIKKQKQLLTNLLRSAFLIAGDPIVWRPRPRHLSSSLWDARQHSRQRSRAR